MALLDQEDDEFSKLSPEQQEEVLKKLRDEEAAYQQSILQDSPTEPEVPVVSAEPAPQQESVLSSILDTAGETIEKIADPIMKYGSAFEKGIEQGFLSGGAEEARAALSGGDYEKVKKEQEAAFKQSEEEYPVTTFIGELGGSVLQGAAVSALTGGAALPASIANVVSKLSKANKAMNIATRIGKTAAIGAVEGAAQGILKSEKSLYEQAKENFKEASKGAALGGVLGGGLESGVVAAKKGGQVVGDFLSKKIDEGKLFPSARPIREAWKLGKREIGVSSEESLKRPTKKLMKILETKVQPKIVESLREVKNLRTHIIDNVDKPIDVSDIIESGVSNLKSQGHLDANKTADFIKNRFKAIQESLPDITDAYGMPTGEVKKIPLSKAKLFIRDLQSEIDSKPTMNEQFKEIVNNIKKNIDSMIDSSITDADAAKAVMNSPEATLDFINLLVKANPKTLADSILEKMKSEAKIKSGDQAIKKAQELVKKFRDPITKFHKDISGLSYDQQKSAIADFLSNPTNKLVLEEAGKNLGPVKILDGKMKNILSAHELLTGKTIAKTDVEKIDNVMELFKNVAGQTKEGVSADISKATYDKALDLLASAIPEAADEIQKVIKPAAQDLFMIRYLHGIGFDPALKDTAIVQKVLGGMPKIAAQTANIAAQSLEAAKKGVAGPIVGMPTTSLIRPTVSALRSLKSLFDMGDNRISKFISEALQTAINSPDEGRRIAILNTLMSYEYFRKKINDPSLKL